MARDELGDSGRMIQRRDVLRTLGAGSAIALAGCDGDGNGGTPTVDTETVNFVLATAESGEYGNVGELERNGFELAVTHLNEGGGLVDSAFDELDGNGVLGRTVESIIENTENDASIARSEVEQHLGDGGPTMVTGGIGGDVVYELNDLAQSAGIVYMAGSAPVPAITGDRCGPTTFRETPHANAVFRAMGQTLRNEFGTDPTYYQLSSEATEGQVMQDACSSYFNENHSPDWRAVGQETALPGSTSFDDELELISSSRADVVFLNLFGLDAVNAVRSAKEILDEDVGIVVPVIADSLEYTIESDVAGVVGTIPWDAGLEGDGITDYNDSYVTTFGQSGGRAQAGSGTAHVIYVQTLLYAAAAERAESFAADAIASELEGMEYDVGLGSQEMRSCDHQARRPVPVVKGINSNTAERNHLEIASVVRDPYGTCEESPAADCSL